MVLPSSPLLAIVLLLPVLLFVTVTGVFTGWLTATVLRTNYRGLLLDALIAPVAFMAIFAIAISIPWHGSYVEDGWTHSNHFPHPRIWALGAAIVGPVIHEVLRFRRRNRA